MRSHRIQRPSLLLVATAALTTWVHVPVAAESVSRDSAASPKLLSTRNVQIHYEIQKKALRHYRRALELEPTSLPMRFSLVRFLLEQSEREDLNEENRQVFHSEALEKFKKIDWPDLLFPSENRTDRARMAKMRSQFRKWKDEVFTTASAIQKPAGDPQ